MHIHKRVHTHIHIHIHNLSPHTITLTRTHSHIHTHSHTYSHTHSLSNAHSHTLCRSDQGRREIGFLGWKGGHCTVGAMKTKCKKCEADKKGKWNCWGVYAEKDLRLLEAKEVGFYGRRNGAWARIDIGEMIRQQVCSSYLMLATTATTDTDADMQSANLRLIRWTRSKGLAVWRADFAHSWLLTWQAWPMTEEQQGCLPLWPGITLIKAYSSQNHWECFFTFAIFDGNDSLTERHVSFFSAHPSISHTVTLMVSKKNNKNFAHTDALEDREMRR
jgi:hypothetical protein